MEQAPRTAVHGRYDVRPDFELNQYIRTFTSASDRVRWVVVATTVICLLVFVGFWNSREGSWINARRTRVHSQVKELTTPPENPQDTETPSPEPYKIDSLLVALDELERAKVQRVLLLEIPFLGITFDVNDLGLFGGVSLLLMVILLMYCLIRQHENLYMCLWKTERVFESEGKREDGDSRANLLYHELAMVQVFSTPPTRARWRPYGISHASKLLFFLPGIVQAVIVGHNLKTRGISEVLKPGFSAVGLPLQFFFLILLLGGGVLCLCYACACDRKWRSTFAYINPELSAKRQWSWREWLGAEVLEKLRNEEEEQ